jgi:DNA-3-methyladenine glycosylase I
MVDERGPTAAATQPRCWWSTSTPAYTEYHDTEWGFPQVDDRRLFEKLCLEGFQAGLSWLTILNKRPAFRAAFDGFDIERVAGYTGADVQRLLGDPGIIRHRGKIEAAIANAQRAIEVIDDCGSLAAYVWQFEPDPSTRPTPITREVLIGLTTSPEAIAMAKDLKRRGWRFLGPTTAYAFMQSVGIVDDHLEECFVRPAAERAREVLVRPQPG